jgi:di/tripeptidase
MMPRMTSPETSPSPDLSTLAQWGFEALQKVVAIESSSDEKSTTIPSTEGQRTLSRTLAQHFEALGFSSESDAAANLIVRIPPTKGREGAPKVAFMVHMDTAHGTAALEKLHVIPSWKGDRVPYPKNERLHVDADAYPLLRAFVGDDLVHGDGDFPFGLDDKLGMAELMTLARLLVQRPSEHGEVLLVFRPDEEIGRMEAVVGLADVLAEKGVQFGYTIDGLEPFEVNVENFDAARARVRIEGRTLALPPGVNGVVRVDVTGVNTHGATAKSEGYLNSTVVFARAMKGLTHALPVSFASDGMTEVNATIDVLLHAADAAALDDVERKLRAAFEREIAPAAKRGAGVAFRDVAAPGAFDDACVRMLAFLEELLTRTGPTPLLSEESSGHQGYTNPHRAVVDTSGGRALVVDLRLRDFTPEALAARAKHVVECAQAKGLVADVVQQYVNMGPSLARFEALPRWAEEAAKDAGFTSLRQPIRGGTGVDPFLTKGIPVANVGTGYFAPESEKELTSKQNIARHVLWLAALLRRIAAAPPA